MALLTLSFTWDISVEKHHVTRTTVKMSILFSTLIGFYKIQAKPNLYFKMLSFIGTSSLLFILIVFT